MSMGDSIILIGMPGAGKSTIGVVLAKTLGMDFLDSDLVICRRTGEPLQKTLDRIGQRAFLELEEDVVCGLTLRRTVLATGGSVPLREKAMEHLQKQGRVVYLEVSFAELERRLSNITTRGIAFGPGEDLRSLMDHRTPLYRRWADLTVSAEPGQDLEAMVTKLVETLK